MLNDILEIPGNRPVFEDLQRLLAEKKAIAFVGAGASAGMYPLWGELIQKLIDYTVKREKAKLSDRERWLADRQSTPQQLVNTIVRKLGQDYYYHFLEKTFSPRYYGADGKRYTPAHAALLRLPFRGYVTTNYDPALAFARMDLRPGCLTTGMPTWQHHGEVHRWLTGDVFEPSEACPILWLHGSWETPSGIVLNAGEYANAYAPGLYRKTFQRLWEQDHLVFAGFGFNDPQFTFMVGEILRDIAGAKTIPRHIGILGLPLDVDGNLPDSDAIAEARANMEEAYHVLPLFYRVKPLPGRKQDHSELLVLLEGLAAADSDSLSPPAAPNFRSHWVHETTNDAKFLGREDEIAQLNRWVADPAVRAIGVVAVGGTGKTALVGHWLKETDGWRNRCFDGLFAWSFYREREPNCIPFLQSLLSWAHDTFNTPISETDLLFPALELLEEKALVVVLDGLEVLQEGPEDETFKDKVLGEFLSGLCARQHESLAVLTSRFGFLDLESHFGTALHQLELPGLTPTHGSALLYRWGVRGSEVDREEVSSSLEGHPLGVRVFAEAIPEARRDHPREFLAEALTAGPASKSPVVDKIWRLLVFYEKHLPPIQVRLLGVVSLFRAPVAKAIVTKLACGLFDETLGPLPSETELAEDLRKLYLRGILTREPLNGDHSYACHPILRDHFRAVLLGKGVETSRRAAHILQQQPSRKRPRSGKEIALVLLAIELLLDAGDFARADEIYQDRLEDGRFFLWIPALYEGLRCALGFVRDEPRQRQCEDLLSRARLGFYLNSVGVFASLSGDYKLAARFLTQGNSVYREMNDRENLVHGLLNEAELATFQGRLTDAVNLATEAIDLACHLRNMRRMINSWAWRGWVRGCSGYVEEAAEDFAAANAFEKYRYHNDLCSSRGTGWSELLFRTGHPALAALRAIANLEICTSRRWNEDVARCHWILGNCALLEGRLAEAEAEICRAEPVFGTGHLFFELARLHVTAGTIALAQHDAAAAFERAAKALSLAQRPRMRLVHADALVLRGRARLLKAETPGASGGPPANALSAALDDANHALRLALDCGYVWAERDALGLQAEAHTALARIPEKTGRASAWHREAALRARNEADALSSRLRLSEEGLARADTRATARLEEWEREEKQGSHA